MKDLSVKIFYEFTYTYASDCFLCRNLHACTPLECASHRPEVVHPVYLLVTMAVCPSLHFLPRDIFQGRHLEPYLWLPCLGHKGPHLGFSLRASWYIALVA